MAEEKDTNIAKDDKTIPYSELGYDDILVHITSLLNESPATATVSDPEKTEKVTTLESVLAVKKDLGNEPESVKYGDILEKLTLVDGHLQSRGFIPGIQGWRIYSNGDAEFNTGIFRKGVIVQGYKLFEAVVGIDGNSDYKLLSEAIDAGATRIFLRVGTYIENDTITIGPNVIITGENRATTIVKLADGTNKDLLHVASNDVTMSSFTLDGNRANQTVTEACLKLVGSSNGVYQYMNILNARGDGIEIVNSDNNKIYDNTFDNCRISGISVDAPSVRNSIRNNQISNCDDVGISINSIGLTDVSGNRLDFNLRGIDVMYANDTKITNNFINSCLRNGLTIAGSKYCLIVGNKFSYNGQQTNNFYNDLELGTTFTSSTSFNTITGNNFIATGSMRVKYNIEEEAGGAGNDFNNITGNTVIGGVLGRIIVTGASTINNSNIEVA